MPYSGALCVSVCTYSCQVVSRCYPHTMHESTYMCLSGGAECSILGYYCSTTGGAECVVHESVLCVYTLLLIHIPTSCGEGTTNSAPYKYPIRDYKEDIW